MLKKNNIFQKGLRAQYFLFIIFCVFSKWNDTPPDLKHCIELCGWTYRLLPGGVLDTCISAPVSSLSVSSCLNSTVTALSQSTAAISTSVVLFM